MSVCSPISKTAYSNINEFSLHVACGRDDKPLFTAGFVDEIMFSVTHNGQANT